MSNEDDSEIPVTVITDSTDNSEKDSNEEAVSLEILKNSKFLIGTSANYSGEGSFTKSKECSEKIKEYDVFVDGGDIQSKGESTIAEINEGQLVIHREGALKKEEITRFF